ncbi:MAG: F-type H+-transporting ATPase subunit delta [Desulfomicrobiaceae bacterium]|nr:F-type H+-transporting ATPase subunit delta [Desulfomicrobiaceae bacterium]
MTGNIVAKRYAKALFAVASSEGKTAVAKYGAELAALAEVLKAAPEILRIFRNPIFSLDEKRGVAASLLDKVSASPMVRNFCMLLADKNRLGFLPEISADYAKLLDEAQGVVRGKVVTAIRLTDAMQKAVVEKLQKDSGRKIVLDYDVDQDIIGGLVLKIGDKVLDASIRAQLQILKENIKRGE